MHTVPSIYHFEKHSLYFLVSDDQWNWVNAVVVASVETQAVPIKKTHLQGIIDWTSTLNRQIHQKQTCSHSSKGLCWWCDHFKAVKWFLRDLWTAKQMLIAVQTRILTYQGALIFHVASPGLGICLLCIFLPWPWIRMSQRTDTSIGWFTHNLREKKSQSVARTSESTNNGKLQTDNSNWSVKIKHQLCRNHFL